MGEAKQAKKRWPPRGQTAKNPQKVFTVAAERRDDGARVERTYDDQGQLVNEWEARLYVQQLGTAENGVVLLNVDAARADFDMPNSAFKAAGGKFGGRKWRLLAKAGLQVVEALRAEGFVVQLDEGGDLDDDIRRAVMTKYLGPLNYRHGAMVVVLNDDGFSVETEETVLPCTLSDALVLDDAGATFTAAALERVRRIRGSAGFPSTGRGTVAAREPEHLGTR